jgi:two-component system phosphate regulon response regulator OmpR
MTDAPPHLLVVDDDARIRQLLTRYLSRNGFIATAARDAAQARRLLESLVFDMMIVDVMMPGEDGVSLTCWVRRTMTIPVLMLTARAETDARIQGLESGADDYLAKPFEPRELLLRCAAILRRAARPERAAPPRTLTLGSARYDIARGELWRNGESVRLTTSEMALMRALSANPNEPVSRATLVGALGGPGGAASERAVDVQITRLRRKLETDPREPRYLQTVRGEGYMLTPD